MRSIISSMGLIESVSERYPTGTAAERGGVTSNISSIFFSSYLAWRIASWYCLHFYSFGEISLEEVGRVPNKVMAYPIEVSQNGALGP